MNFRMHSPWLKSAKFDSAFIISPAFVSVGLAFLLAALYGRQVSVSMMSWVLLILCIDVSHVYSTLFRTYFNAHEWVENKIILILIPLAIWVLGTLLFTVNALLFWRVLSYVAVYHFIRQQYGFIRLYSRGDVTTFRDVALSSAAVYLATLYPMIYWHTHTDRNFNWFVESGFVTGVPQVVCTTVGWIYVLTLICYIINEIFWILKHQRFNMGKNLILFGTIVSWYVGIVHFNADLLFTVTNVMAHGIPYIALVWIYGEKQKDKESAPLVLGRFSYKMFFSTKTFFIFLGILLVFAFVEEGLWDGFVWRERLEFFSVFAGLPEITSYETLSWLVPLLVVPQATHYVLDGFIWRLKDTTANWQKVLLEK